MTSPTITSRWPIFRTNPARIAEVGAMAILTAIASVLVLEGRLDLDVWGPFASTTVILAMLCWFIVRMFHPVFIGIPDRGAGSS